MRRTEPRKHLKKKVWTRIHLGRGRKTHNSRNRRGARRGQNPQKGMQGTEKDKGQRLDRREGKKKIQRSVKHPDLPLGKGRGCPPFPETVWTWKKTGKGAKNGGGQQGDTDEWDKVLIKPVLGGNTPGGAPGPKKPVDQKKKNATRRRRENKKTAKNKSRPSNADQGEQDQKGRKNGKKGCCGALSHPGKKDRSSTGGR